MYEYHDALTQQPPPNYVGNDPLHSYLIKRLGVSPKYNSPGNVSKFN